MLRTQPVFVLTKKDPVRTIISQVAELNAQIRTIPNTHGRIHQHLTAPRFDTLRWNRAKTLEVIYVAPPAMKEHRLSKGA